MDIYRWLVFLKHVKWIHKYKKKYNCLLLDWIFKILKYYSIWFWLYSQLQYNCPLGWKIFDIFWACIFSDYVTALTVVVIVVVKCTWPAFDMQLKDVSPMPVLSQKPWPGQETSPPIGSCCCCKGLHFLSGQQASIY